MRDNPVSFRVLGMFGGREKAAELSRRLMKKVKKAANFLIYLVLFPLWYRRGAPERTNIDYISFPEKAGGGRPLPRIVWIYWDDPDYPEYIDILVSRIRDLNRDFDVRFLNRKTVTHYIDDYMNAQPGLSAVTRADLIRLELIKRYGGIWIDATSIVFENFSWIEEKFCEGAYNFVGYFSACFTVNPNFPILENWLIAALPEDELICAWLDELKKIVQFGADAYFFHLKARSDYQDILQKIKYPEYFLAYLSCQVAMRQVASLSLHVRDSGQSGLLYHDLVNWVPYRIALMLCASAMPGSPPPLVKITHTERYLINVILKFNLFNRKSFAGLLKG
ncbi:hypothetical protein HLH44_12065 [Gluconacetobacter sp. 1c LMG 22058]|uniref:Mannosyltransferase OCH1 n=1 Tax=Gluconacetobacter dulcium TaxID=2729096 RepID=A0A7W4K0L5_9PROT|nr:capsular polysaccharide synthesis protein [Gluconacetobacter dulcium]MBB2198178.1 hypothetical protein [Gluconacetobacter dulcium]